MMHYGYWAYIEREEEIIAICACPGPRSISREETQNGTERRGDFCFVSTNIHNRDEESEIC